MSVVTELPHDESACWDRFVDTQNVDFVARFTVDGEPVSKSRARFTHYGSKVRAYTPEKTKVAEAAMGRQFRRVSPEHVPDGENAFGVACIFFACTFQRRDVDNMIKLVCDGLNGVAWVDDSQVYEVSGRRGRCLPGEARTEVLIYRLGPLWNPTKLCDHCGKSIRVYRSVAPKYCSRDCVNAARRARRKPRTCKHCGNEFFGDKPTDGRVYCSAQCKSDSARVDLVCIVCGDDFTCWRSWQRKYAYCDKPECKLEVWRRVAAENRATRRPGTCRVCGAGTSKKQYERCNACSRANLPIPGK